MRNKYRTSKIRVNPFLKKNQSTGGSLKRSLGMAFPTIPKACGFEAATPIEVIYKFFRYKSMTPLQKQRDPCRVFL